MHAVSCPGSARDWAQRRWASPWQQPVGPRSIGRRQALAWPAEQGWLARGIRWKCTQHPSKHAASSGLASITPSKNFAASPKPNATTSNAPSAPKSADAPNENVRRRSDPLYRPRRTGKDRSTVARDGRLPDRAGLIGAHSRQRRRQSNRDVLKIMGDHRRSTMMLIQRQTKLRRSTSAA
jgi:hypothetical protein